MNEKSCRLIYTTENNLEIARTSRDTRKTSLMNYVIDSNKKKKKSLEKKSLESLEYARKLSPVESHFDVKKACRLQIY